MSARRPEVRKTTHEAANDAARDADFWSRIPPLERFLRVFQLSEEAYALVGKLPVGSSGHPRSVARVLRP